MEFKVLYLLNAWSKVLLKKLTGSQLVKKFPEFYGIQSSLLNAWSKVLLKKLTGSQLVKKFPEFYGIQSSLLT